MARWMYSWTRESSQRYPWAITLGEMIMTLLNLHRPMAPVSSMSRRVKVVMAVKDAASGAISIRALPRGQ